MNIVKAILGIKLFRYYRRGIRYYNDPVYRESRGKHLAEYAKTPLRTEIINFLLGTRPDPTYLEIGVRNPEGNFNKIKAVTKYSVDPGVEFKENPVDFKMTSDEFFERLSGGQVLSPEIRFDVIFIDGLHLADQVDRDIENALKYIRDDGFVVLHDCNPPTEFHARETFSYKHTAAKNVWNGTTWKAFLKWRCEPSVQSCCIDTDWGIGVLSKQHPLGDSIQKKNEFYEYHLLEENRSEYLNLMDFHSFKQKINGAG